MDGRQLRDGLFSLYTRRFGTVTELMVRRLVNLGKAQNQFHDLFADAVVIFRIKSSEIGSQIFYSDKQHKGNEGEGQFHLNRQTLPIHLERYRYKVITYDELLELLS